MIFGIPGNNIFAAIKMVESQTAAALQSNIEYSPENHFPLENIPFGAFLNLEDGKSVHVCTRIGDSVIDLAVLEQYGLFDGPLFSTLTKKNIFNQSTINQFIALGKDFWHEARVTIQKLFTKGDDRLSNISFKDSFTFSASECRMVLPI